MPIELQPIPTSGAHDLRVPVILPAANPKMAQRHIPKWIQAGYRVVMFQDKVRFDIHGAEVYLSETYTGYAAAINEMYRNVRGISAAQVVVLIGEDMDPDPNKTPYQIRDEFLARFPDTFGVMQPTGDNMDGVDRICGSPWVGRSFASRINGGIGPLWPEYFHFFADEELFNVSTMLGCLQQRPDLKHYHDHWTREGRSRPEHMNAAQERWDKDKAIHTARKAAGYPGHQPKFSNFLEPFVHGEPAKTESRPPVDSQAALAAARRLSIAVFQMRDQWSESSPERQAELWKSAHDRNSELFEIIGPTP